MKTLLCIIGILYGSFSYTLSANDILKVEILPIIEPYPFGYFVHHSFKPPPEKKFIPFFVSIRNVYSSDVFISEQKNSFGYKSLFFEVKIKDKTFIIERKERIFTANTLGLYELKPNRAVLIPFMLNSDWKNERVMTQNIKNKEAFIRACFILRKDDPLLLGFKKIGYYRDRFIWTGKVYSDWYSIEDIWFLNGSVFNYE